MKSSTLFLFAAAILAVGLQPVRLSAEPDGQGIYFSVADLGQLSLDEVVNRLEETRIVVIGEHHGDRAHHRLQLALLQALSEKGRKVAVGLEMFRGDAQEELDKWIAGGLTLEELFSLYVDNWVASYWWLYADILVYAREKSMPLLGLNLPQETVREVANRGFSGISDELRATLPEVRCDVSSDYRRFLEEVTEMKAGGNGSFVRFCEAQVLWDTIMAERSVAYAEAHPNTIVVILAGHFHAWKHGIAAQVDRLSDLPVKVILPSGDVSILRYNIFLKDADFVWWNTEPAVQ